MEYCEFSKLFTVSMKRARARARRSQLIIDDHAINGHDWLINPSMFASINWTEADITRERVLSPPGKDYWVYITMNDFTVVDSANSLDTKWTITSDLNGVRIILTRVDFPYKVLSHLNNGP